MRKTLKVIWINQDTVHHPFYNHLFYGQILEPKKQKLNGKLADFRLFRSFVCIIIFERLSCNFRPVVTL